MIKRKSSKVLSRSKVASMVGVSRTYITLLIQGKHQPSRQLVGKLQQLALTCEMPQELAKLVVG
jgi:transcriptional regulator with XRE-family HTH domain